MIDLDDLSKIARLAKRYEQRHEATLFNSLEIRKNDLEILFNEENEIKTNQEEDTRKDNRSNDKKIIDLTKLNIKNFQLNTIWTKTNFKVVISNLDKSSNYLSE